MEFASPQLSINRYRRLIQRFWSPQPAFDITLNEVIWCLGRAYRLSGSDEGDVKRLQSQSVERATSQETEVNPETSMRSKSSPPPLSALTSTGCEVQSWPIDFLDDFLSRFWLTYRSGFEPIITSKNPDSSSLPLPTRIKMQIIGQPSFSSDTGWGCMIRSGQSLLCNALGCLKLGREWRQGMLDREERELVSFFADDERAPYSIHNFVQYGSVACATKPGEWFGPSATARCIQALVRQHKPGLRVYSTVDGPDIFEDKIFEMAKDEKAKFTPVLILVGTRLGIDKITPVYWQALLASFKMKQSVGIAGGLPSSSYYFVGAHGPYLLYLDPHETKNSLPFHANPMNYTKDDIAGCHPQKVRKIHIRELDPSMLFGFLITDETDWKDWRQAIEGLEGMSVIHVADCEPHRTGLSIQRDAAVEEVEVLSDEDRL